MQYLELIKLQPQEILDVISLSTNELTKLNEITSRLFTQRGNAYVAQGVYKEELIVLVTEYVDSLQKNIEVRHSVWPEYDDRDYQEAAFWRLLFPEIWIDELNFSTACSGCGGRSLRPTTRCWLTRSTPEINQSSASRVN